MDSQKHKVGTLADFPLGEATEVKIGDVAAIVCNVEGELYCIEDKCSHDDAPLCGGQLQGCEIVCPRHFARFDVRTGRVAEPPAIYPIEAYQVEVVGQHVYVELES